MPNDDTGFPDLGDELDGPDPAALPLRKDADPLTDEQVLEEFGDLDEFLAPETKKLPYKGIVYDFPADVSARAWLLLQKIRREGIKAGMAERKGESYDAEAIIMGDGDEVYLREQVMGEAMADLEEDNVPARVIERMFSVLMIWHLAGKEMALRMWKGDVSQGEALARGNREERRRQAQAKARAERRKASSRAGR